MYSGVYCIYLCSGIYCAYFCSGVYCASVLADKLCAAAVLCVPEGTFQKLPGECFPVGAHTGRQSSFPHRAASLPCPIALIGSAAAPLNGYCVCFLSPFD